MNCPLTALSVRSHWKTISLICVRMVLLALARSILLTPASAIQLWYWSWASSAWPQPWKQRVVWGRGGNAKFLSTISVQECNCNAKTTNYFPLSSPLPTFCRASSSIFLFFSSCLFPAFDCSSWERLVDERAFWYSSLLWAFSTRALRKVASASCCQR